MKDPRWNASGNTVSSLSETKEMEGKLIGTVNVNTWIDVRDRKSGLVNWLTVSLLYPLLSLFLLFPSSLFLSLLRGLHLFPLSLAPTLCWPSDCPLLFISPFLRISCFPPSVHSRSPLRHCCQFTDSRNWTFDLAFGY